MYAFGAGKRPGRIKCGTTAGTLPTHLELQCTDKQRCGPSGGPQETRIRPMTRGEPAKGLHAQKGEPMGNPIANTRGKPATMTRLLAVFALAAGILAAGPNQAHASTSQFRGVNWADQRDNFVNGVLYPSGLGTSDTYSSASAVADQVVGQMYSITGANTVRMPINEPTVAGYWNTYTGAIDTALTKGNVILAYWAYTGGKPTSTAGVQPDVGHGRRQVRHQPQRLLRGRQRAVRLQHRPTWTTSTTAGWPGTPRVPRCQGDPRRRRAGPERRRQSAATAA